MKKTKRMTALLLVLIMAVSMLCACESEESGLIASNAQEAIEIYKSNGFETTSPYTGSEADKVASSLGFSNLESAAIVTKQYETEPEDISKIKSKIYTVEITVRDFGVMTLELYHLLAPKSVDAFVGYARSGFYDGLKFHRIIDGFMIQGGDPTGTGFGSSDLENIEGEFAANGWYRNTALKFTEGVIGMARAKAYNTASSQFFICLDDYNSGNGQYASFGRLISGNDVLKSIGSVKVGGSENSTPVTDVIMDSVKVVSEREELLASELVTGIQGKVYYDMAYVFFFDDKKSAEASLEAANKNYGGAVNNAFASEFEIVCIDHAIIVGTKGANDLIKLLPPAVTTGKTE